jgi:hypothetical protein
MKHLSKFQASKVADFVRVNFYRSEYADMMADDILKFADKDGMIYHFAVSDSVGSDWMREIEANCVMYVELERA